MFLFADINTLFFLGLQYTTKTKHYVNSASHPCTDVFVAILSCFLLFVLFIHGEIYLCSALIAHPFPDKCDLILFDSQYLSQLPKLNTKMKYLEMQLSSGSLPINHVLYFVVNNY